MFIINKQHNYWLPWTWKKIHFKVTTVYVACYPQLFLYKFRKKIILLKTVRLKTRYYSVIKSQISFIL